MHPLWVSSGLLSVAVISTVAQNNFGKERVHWLTFPGHSSSLNEVMAGAHAGRKAETMEKFCLLTCSLQPAQLAFLHSPSPPSGRRYRLQWAEPFYIKEQLQNAPQPHSTGQSDGGSFSVEVPSSLVTLGCVKLTVKPHQSV